MSSSPTQDPHQDTEKPRQSIPQAGSTRFRNKDYAEQREHWPEDDDRR